MTEKEIEILLETSTSVFKIDDILKPTRQLNYVQARLIVMKVLKDEGFGYSKIGRILNKNHANVIHHLKYFDFQIKYNKDLENKYERVLFQLAQGKNIIYELSHNALIKYTFNLEERLKKIILSKNRNKNYEKLFKFIERNVPESNLKEAKQRLKDLTDGLYN